MIDRMNAMGMDASCSKALGYDVNGNGTPDVATVSNGRVTISDGGVDMAEAIFSGSISSLRSQHPNVYDTLNGAGYLSGDCAKKSSGSSGWRSYGPETYQDGGVDDYDDSDGSGYDDGLDDGIY